MSGASRSTLETVMIETPARWAMSFKRIITSDDGLLRLRIAYTLETIPSFPHSYHIVRCNLLAQALFQRINFIHVDLVVFVTLLFRWPPGTPCCLPGPKSAIR